MSEYWKCRIKSCKGKIVTYTYIGEQNKNENNENIQYINFENAQNNNVIIHYRRTALHRCGMKGSMF